MEKMKNNLEKSVNEINSVHTKIDQDYLIAFAQRIRYLGQTPKSRPIPLYNPKKEGKIITLYD